jgi:predicted RecA/RadA family phage recombinase
MAKFLELYSADYVDLKDTVAGAAVDAGDYVNVGGVHGFYLVDGAIGDEIAIVIEAPIVKATKEAALAINAGDVVYYDTAADEIDKTDTNVLVGYAVRDALAADTHVFIRWDGLAAQLKA